MIETPDGVRRATEIAVEADFLSIGTNDLVSSTLGLHRDLPLASASTAADPAVLAHVVSIVAAGHEVGITVEVCGEAAGVPELVVLFVGLGVDELSVAPARVDLVRGVVRCSPRSARQRSRATRSLLRRRPPRSSSFAQVRPETSCGGARGPRRRPRPRLR